MIKNILVAIDFSDYSLSTLRYGLTLAQEMDAQVTVVSVINDRDVAAVRTAQQYTDKVSPEKYIDEQKAYRMERIDTLVQETGCGKIDVKKIIRVGLPASEILKTIKETGVDLVVIGTKGRGNAANFIFGSIAEKVNRRSPVSVLSVRGKEHADLVCKLDD